ncbi:MAG: hypothetical protein WC583_02755 [Candidatus Omnitrophota bacterium]|jgi:hypothetical protein|nr:hypothetical protein [Sphaerochaeta sp.]
MISSYTVDRVTIVRWNGNDQWGEPNAKTNVSVRGYVDWRTRLVKDISGEDVASSVTVYLQMRRTDAALGRALRHEDRLIVDGMERAIINIREPKSFSCPHYEVFLA